MKNLESGTVDLIREILPALDELIALMEYYDNPTYRATVEHIAKSLSDRGLVAFDEKGLYFDKDRHDVHEVYPKPDCDIAYIAKTHVRGYAIEGEVIRKAVVDLIVPEEE